MGMLMHHTLMQQMEKPTAEAETRKATEENVAETEKVSESAPVKKTGGRRKATTK